MLHRTDCNQVLKAAGGFQVEINSSETICLWEHLPSKTHHLVDLWAIVFLNSEVSQAKTTKPAQTSLCHLHTGSPENLLHDFTVSIWTDTRRIPEQKACWPLWHCAVSMLGLWFSLIPYLISQESQFTLISTYGPSSCYLETMVTLNISEQPLTFLSQTMLQSFLIIPSCE